MTALLDSWGRPARWLLLVERRLKTTEVCSFSLGEKSEVQVLAGCGPSESLRGEFSLRFPLLRVAMSPRQPLALGCVTPVPAAWPHGPPRALVCLCPGLTSSSFLLDLGPALISHNPILVILCVKSSFPNTLSFQMGVKWEVALFNSCPGIQGKDSTWVGGCASHTGKTQVFLSLSLFFSGLKFLSFLVFRNFLVQMVKTHTPESIVRILGTADGIGVKLQVSRKKWAPCSNVPRLTSLCLGAPGPGKRGHLSGNHLSVLELVGVKSDKTMLSGGLLQSWTRRLGDPTRAHVH